MELSSGSAVAALPETFDHVPQILWERSVISIECGKREAGSGKRHVWLLTGLVVADDTNNSGREQAYLGIIALSREYCKICTIWASFCKSNLLVMSKTPKRLQTGQLLLLSVQKLGKREAGSGSGSGSGRGRGVAREGRRCECVTKKPRQASSGVARRLSTACSYKIMQERRGVLIGAFQSEREEETRDRAERGSVVRGSPARKRAPEASVAPKRIPRLDPRRDPSEAQRCRDS